MSGWLRLITECSLVFLRTPKQRKSLFVGGKGAAFAKGDPRVRNIPFATRRPTFKEVKLTHSKLASVYPCKTNVITSTEVTVGENEVPKSKETKGEGKEEVAEGSVEGVREGLVVQESVVEGRVERGGEGGEEEGRVERGGEGGEEEGRVERGGEGGEEEGGVERGGEGGEEEGRVERGGEEEGGVERGGEGGEEEGRVERGGEGGEEEGGVERGGEGGEEEGGVERGGEEEQVSRKEPVEEVSSGKWPQCFMATSVSPACSVAGLGWTVSRGKC